MHRSLLDRWGSKYPFILMSISPSCAGPVCLLEPNLVIAVPMNVLDRSYAGRILTEISDKILQNWPGMIGVECYKYANQGPGLRRDFHVQIHVSNKGFKPDIWLTVSTNESEALLENPS